MDTPTMRNGSALNRRDALKLGVFGAAALSLPLSRTLKAGAASRISSSKIPRPYTIPFTTPPVLSPVRTDPVSKKAYYEIRQRQVNAQILPGVNTPVWAYNGLTPGPTIKARQGWETVVRQINELPAAHPTLRYQSWTSTHLHGMPSRPEYDGYASDKTLPGQWKNYHYPNSCSGRTLWYHDHGVHHTAENVYMGLAGMYILTDSVEDSLPIPKGRFDVPVIISDKMFAENGSLMWDDDSHSGLYGDVITVNGRPWPTMNVEKRKYRFRVLNASLARGYMLALSNGQSFQVIGTDGGLMKAPQTVTSLRMGPAERYEIVIDFSKLTTGQKIQLINRGVKNSDDYDHTNKVMQFVGTGTAPDLSNNTVPSVLNPNAPAMNLTPSMSVATRRMRVERTNSTWTINGKTWKDVEDSGFNYYFANPKFNTTETWEIENSSGGWNHPVHIHLVDFQIISRNGRPPFAYERGPKDTVYVGEGETVRVLIHFNGSDHGKYMIHCHNLSHEDHDMMTQFLVDHTDSECDPIYTAPPQTGTPPPL